MKYPFTNITLPIHNRYSFETTLHRNAISRHVTILTMTNKFPAQPLFHTSTAQEFLVTPAKLPATLQTLRQDIQTGLVEIFLPALEKRYAILFAGGEPVNIYSLQRPVKRILPNSRLEKLLLGFDPDEKVLLRVLSLSPQTIRMVKIWIEQQADRASQPLATIEIEEHLSSLQKKRHGAGLLQLAQRRSPGPAARQR